MPTNDTSIIPKIKRSFDLLDLVASRIPMGPRKKSKTQSHNHHDESKPASASPSAAATPASSTTNVATYSQSAADAISPTLPVEPAAPTPTSNTSARAMPSEVRGYAWYGSWRQKAQPVTKENVENVSAASTQTVGNSNPRDINRKSSEDPTSPSPRRYLSGSRTASNKGTPLAATTTNLSITSSNGRVDKVENKISDHSQAVADDQVNRLDSVDPPEAACTKPQEDIHTELQKEQNRPSSSGGWLAGWWSRPDGYVEGKTKSEAQNKRPSTESESKSLTAIATSSDSLKEPATQVMNTDDNLSSDQEAHTTETNSKSQVDANRSSWFWRWSVAQNSTTGKPRTENIKDSINTEHSSQSSVDVSKSGLRAAEIGLPLSKSAESSIKDGKDGKNGKNGRDANTSNLRKSSGWAFWSKDSGTKSETSQLPSSKQVGELAVANTPSQSHPEAAQFNEVNGALPKEAPKPPGKKSSLSKNRNEANSTPTPLRAPEVDTSKNTNSASTETLVETLAKQSKWSKQTRDLLLPEFRKTYSLVQQPSIWQNIRQYFTGEEQHHPHLHIINNVPRVKKALAIGVHGFFPAAILQKVLGPPTGTSIRFSNMAAAAIKTWTESRGYECEIEKVALEGEGFIADRVDTLWKLLLNWIDHVRSADLILFACHSQGVPVTIMLVDRLVKFGCISPSASIGICAMAGVNLGPFAEYKTQLFGRSALELFEFSNSSSRVSKAYMTALEEILKHGVKIIYAGSLDDQLVSLESSTFSNISHPCIYRAVFVDGRLFTSDFITELVGFALKLRNLGLSDHGLIRELSPALAGSLYTGEGHSRLYDAAEVYNLAVSHTLETTRPENIPLIVKNYDGPPGSKDSNPFFLPWAMRGVLEEEKVRKELGDECRKLLSLFEDWKPNSKGLKDVKFRLEALKSKL